MNINLSKVKKSKISDVDFSNLGFCKYYTDHMFICDYEDKSWKNFRIAKWSINALWICSR